MDLFLLANFVVAIVILTRIVFDQLPPGLIVEDFPVISFGIILGMFLLFLMFGLLM